MNTAYKTRGFWMMQALELGASAVFEEDRPHRGGAFSGQAETITLHTREAAKVGAFACAPAGAACLTPIYVDRQGHTLPEYRI